MNGKSVRGWQSDDLLAEFSGNLSVTVTVITREDRTITDLFLMTNRENDLNYLWALRQLVKLRCGEHLLFEFYWTSHISFSSFRATVYCI